MRRFHSPTVGDILTELKEWKLDTLTRSTLYRLEKKLGFDKPGRLATEWRVFPPAKKAAFQIAVLEYYEKPLTESLQHEKDFNPEVKAVLEKASKRVEDRVEDQKRIPVMQG